MAEEFKHIKKAQNKTSLYCLDESERDGYKMDDSLFYEIKITCPVCNTEFETTKTKGKVKENMPIGYESYLVPIYPVELANPLSYEIDICPHCNYAAFHNDFKDKKSNASKVFAEDLKKILKEVKFDVIYRNYELARLSYVLAAFLYEKENPKDLIKLGKCYIRVAWYSKELKEIDFYRTALKKAMDTYMAAYNNIDDFTMSSILIYLMSSISIEIGDYDFAAPFINKLNGNPEAKKISSIKEKLEELTMSLRKRMKEIEEETKTLNDEEKKRAKEFRQQSVKPKPYLEPFGIELKKPSLLGIEKRVQKEKGELEDKFGIKLTGKKTLLIVDDSRIVRATIRNLLESTCDIVGEATNGNEALQMYEVLKPDFVTLDLEMPGIGGVETLKKIIAFDRRAKVIIVSASSDSKNVVNALKTGALGYVLKPVNREKIIDLIHKNS